MSPLLITAGSLYDGTGSAPRPDAAVLIADGLVVFAGARSELPTDLIPDARIDVPDGAVIPGLIDAHVHTTSLPAMRAYLSHGVTTVRYAGMATSIVNELRRGIAELGLPGPRILDCGPMIDGAAPAWPAWSAVATTPREARELAARLAGSGQFDGLYAVQRVSPDLLRPIVEAAHEHGIPVTGQLWATDAATAASVGVDQLDNNARIFVSRDWPAARLLAYDSMPARLANMAHAWLTLDWVATTRVMDAMVEANLTYCPTFVVWQDSGEEPSPERDLLAARALVLDAEAYRAWERTRGRTQAGWTAADLGAWRAALEPRLEWVSRFRERGGRVTVGTDMQFGALVIDRELGFIEQAGFSFPEAIAAATGLSAAALGIGGEVGTIEPGKIADLVVLKANPQNDPSASSQVASVIVGGRPWTPEPI